MIRLPAPTVTWQESHQTRTVALNVGGRYMTLAVELVLGLLMLPINTRYLGASDYGLWILSASIVAYFPVLDLGYGSAMERFIAHYRAQKDARAINEITSTLIIVFATFGLIALALTAIIAWNIGPWFNLQGTQARTGALVLLLVGMQFAFGFPFAIFGAVCNGFQRTYLNAAVGSAVAVAVGIVNISVIMTGGGLVELVAALTLTRMAGYFAYRLNAYRVFPLLRVRPSLFRKERLKEMSGFSVYMLIQDAANRANYATDPVVIAAFLLTGAVAVWTVAQRLADAVLQLTNQLNYVLFPVVVDCHSTQRNDRLRDLLLEGTRLSLATSLPVAGSLFLLAEPVVIGWTGPEFRGAVTVLQIMTLVVLVRVGSATASTVLAGGGHHRLLASSNLIAAAGNIGLSILLIRSIGLSGVAIATLIAVVVRATAVLIPVACYRVGISPLRFLASAVWPAAWPAFVALSGLALIRHRLELSMLQAVLFGAATGVVHALLFVGLAINREERNRYLGKLRSIAGLPALEAA